MTGTQDGAFPELTDDLIEKVVNVVNIEYVAQYGDVWREVPAMAVLLAIETLAWLDDARTDRQVVRMAYEVIFHYGNWRNRDLGITERVRQEMYRRNYAGETWEEYYKEDGF